MFAEDDLLPLSALQHLVFCERRAALIHIEGVWDENAATIEGSRLHDSVHDVGTDSRGEARVARGLLLRSLELGLSGKTDMVEFHLLSADEPEASGVVLPGVSGRWRPYPVEFKRGRRRNERSYEVQVCAQALCLEEMFGVKVPEGALFYGKTMRRQKVVFDERLRRDTRKAAVRLHELFRLSQTPRANYVKNKCRQCSLYGLCLPEQVGRGRDVGCWLTRVTQE
uniref:CRISPR-associated exonuclease Cas4 n=1 Tax=candidate division WOR-3 bacterium TaxID=2052148 RepID=A0A7C4CBL9_UNCW3